MDFGLNEEQAMLQEMAKSFAQKEIAPTVETDEKEHKYNRDIVRKMAELGLFGCVAPEKYGGNEMGYLAATLAAFEVSKESPSYSMRTTAKEVDDGFILNGSKMWISGIPDATVGIVYAMTDREKKHRGLSAFMVDMKTSGIEQRAIHEKLGLYSSPTGEIIFEEAKIPKDAIVGKPGDGFKIAMFMLDRTRLSCAARAAGVAEKCFELAKQYANERIQFGQPIIEFQMVQDQLARMWCEHEAAKLLVLKAAWIVDNLERMGGRPSVAISTAKYYSAEAAVMAANEAMKVYGSYGFGTEYPIERYYRDAKSYQSVEGTSNIQKVIIARNFIEKRD